MSGHSHWKTTKRVKESEDKKRSQAFSKLSRMISIAAKERGGNIETNSSLRFIIEKAKNFNLPKENIERAIKKGISEIKGMKLRPIIFEAYGPAGIAIIIEGITDNKNRVLGEIKQALAQNNGKLVGEGGAQWMFEKKIREPGFLEWTPKQKIEVSEKDKAACRKLFEELSQIQDVHEIYSNL